MFKLFLEGWEDRKRKKIIVFILNTNPMTDTVSWWTGSSKGLLEEKFL